MEGLLVLLVLGIGLSVIITPFLVIGLFSRLGRLEKQVELSEQLLKKQREELNLLRQKSQFSDEVIESKKVDGSKSNESKNEPVSRVSEKQKKETSFIPSEKLPKEVPNEVTKKKVVRNEGAEKFVRRDHFQEESPVTFWLKKMGLMPPSRDQEGSNPMAWWSTRIGLIFAIIAAVFFGVHVNKNTVPLVRLLELVVTSLGVFAVGCGFERKLKSFGRAITAGGLALLYVAAFAAYGLPAMKVIESPLVGTFLQFGALGLTIAWSLWRGREQVFGLALVLGYVTCWFSASEGLAPVTLIALLVLSVAGSLLYALRGWLTAVWSAILGSGIGLCLLAGLTWSGEVSPSQSISLASALVVTIAPLVAVGRRQLMGEKIAHVFVPIITSVGLLAGGVITWVCGFSDELYYASFAVLLLGVGWWWKRNGGEGLWLILWAKASVLIAMLIIASCDGPVRLYSLLAQVGGLVFLARNRSRVIFEIGAVLAMMAGWMFLREIFKERPIEIWGSEDYFALGYLVVGQGLVYTYRFLLGEEGVRRVAAGVLTVIIAAFFVVTANFEVEASWGILLPLGFGILSLIQVWALRQKDGVITPWVVLMGTLLILMNRWESDLSLGWQSLLWVVFAWGFYFGFWKEKRVLEKWGARSVLWSSVVAIVFAVVPLLGEEWLSVVGLSVAVLWSGIGGWRGMKILRDSAVLPGTLSASYFGLVWCNGSGSIIEGLVLLLAILWWAIGYYGERGMSEKKAESVLPHVRTLSLGLVIFRLLTNHFDGVDVILPAMMIATVILVIWRFLKDWTLSWLGVVFAVVSLWPIFFERGAIASGVIALIVILSIVNGIWLSRSQRGDFFARPKVASVFWGAAVILTSLVGLGTGESVVNWATAGWAVAAVALLVSGFWAGLRGYRIIALLGIGATILRLFTVDIQDSFWRIVAFGVTGGLLVGIGYLYHRFHRRLADSDLDWETPKITSTN